MAHIGQLRDRLEHRLLASVPSVMVMGGSQPRVPGTVNLAFEFIEGEPFCC
jgi:cysteine desulfurase